MTPTKYCVICKQIIINRSPNGKAVTCSPKCAGKLAREQGTHIQLFGRTVSIWDKKFNVR